MKRRGIYIFVVALLIAAVCGIGIYRRQNLKKEGRSDKDITSIRQNTESPEGSSIKKKQTFAPTKPPVPDKTAAPRYDKIISHGKIQSYDNGTIVLDNAAYELYTYIESSAERYAALINKLTKSLDNSAEVYTMIAPTSVGITLPDNKRDKVNSSSQKEALERLQKKLSGKGKFVPLYDTMMRHRKDYIYFRTDHHWTSRGAYYAYEAFCHTKGIEPYSLSSYTKTKVKGFWGTFYSDTNQNKNLKADVLISYHPHSKKLTMKYTTATGITAKAPVIADASDYSAGLKYCAYIAGDNPYTVIRNKEIKEKTSCVVIKESYGNAFIPYLADHYRTVYVIDYRYWEGNVTNFIKKRKIKDVLLINNISMTRNSYLIGKLAQIIL